MTKRQMERAFDEIGMGTTFSLLESARRGENEERLIAAAMLRQPDGRELYAYTCEEYGDGDGINNIDEWVAEVHRTPGLLVEGESLRRAVFRVVTVEEVPQKK
jgi:hypothetical protein